MSSQEASPDQPPSRRWSKVVTPFIATLFFLGTLLPSVGGFSHFLIIITVAILPIALLISGIRRRAAVVERAGWIWFALNCLVFLMIISG